MSLILINLSQNIHVLLYVGVCLFHFFHVKSKRIFLLKFPLLNWSQTTVFVHKNDNKVTYSAGSVSRIR